MRNDRQVYFSGGFCGAKSTPIRRRSHEDYADTFIAWCAIIGLILWVIL